MNQEQNNLNPNNFNTQGNNGIPNNQPLNNQNFNQGMGFNQQAINPQPQPTPSNEQPIPQPMNTIESGNTSNQNFNSKPPKKINLGLIIGIIAVVAVVNVGIVFGSKLLSNSGSNNNSSENNIGENNNSNNSDEINSIENTKYAIYTADYSKESRNRDYYWNINTDTFDKTKFDGKISFFGNVIESKITGKTLADNGYNFSEVTYYTCNDIFHINDEIEKNYIQKCGQLSKNGKSYPIDYSSVGIPTLINFDKNDNFMNDNVEIYYEYNKTNDYVDFVTETEESNIIFPYFDGIKYDDLSIDLIIEKMGVPTYVSDRTDAEDYPMTFSYYYVYDDYVFKFDFIHITSTKFTGVTYMGRNIFNHSRIEYYYDDNNDETYRTYNLKDLMDDEYKTYLKSIS